MSTPTPTLTPAQVAADELCPLSSDKPIAAVWKRDAAAFITAQYRPLLEQARDTLLRAEDRADNAGVFFPNERAQIKQTLAVLNHALGEKSS